MDAAEAPRPPREEPERGSASSPTGPGARLATLLVAVAVAFPLGDAVGGAGSLWALAGSVVAGIALGIGPLVRQGPGSGSGARLALVLAGALAVHAMLVGVGYLGATSWTKLAGPLVLFALAAGTRGQDRETLSAALTITTLIGAARALEQLAFPAPMPESWVDPERYRQVTLRLTGPLANPNLFGAYLAMVLPVHAGRYGFGGYSGGRAIAEGVAAVLSGALLLLTFSRGGWLAAMTGLAALALLARRARLPAARGRLAVMAAAAAIAGLAVAPAVIERLRVSGDSTELGVAQRGALYRGVLRGIAARPLSGWGLGTFQTAFPRHRLTGGYYPRDAHSSWLHVAFEAGLPGLGLYAALVLAVLAGGVKAVRGGGRPEADRVAALAGAIAACGAFMFVAGLAYFQLDVPFLAILALAAAGPATAAAEPRAPAGPARIMVMLLAMMLAAGGVLWSAVAVVDPALRGDAETAAQTRERAELAARLMPFREELWNDAGEAQEAAGDLAAAERSFTRGLEVDPYQGRFLLSRARVRVRLRRIAEARSDLDMALAGDPWSEEVLVMRGALLSGTGEPELARADLERALSTNRQYLKLNPGTYAMAARMLADLHARAGRKVEAAAMTDLAASLERERR